MENNELQNIWKSYDKSIQNVLALNKDVAITLSKQKLDKQVSRLYRPKWLAVLIGVPYTLLLICITFVAYISQAYFVSFGFGAIALVMIITLVNYFHQLYLIDQIRHSEEVLSTQQRLARLKISTFNTLNVAVFQLPFWSLCWVSIEALKESPILYGGTNLIVFLMLGYLSYWLFKKLSFKNKNSRIRDFFLSGNDWEPIVRAERILEQIKNYEQ